MSPWLVREFAQIVAPFLAHVFNYSLEKGYLPALQKKAIVYPGLKKPSLDPDDLSNYRPISNLSFVSKLLERAVFMLSCSSISLTMNCCLQFNPHIGSFFDQNCCFQGNN